MIVYYSASRRFCIEGISVLYLWIAIMRGMMEAAMAIQATIVPPFFGK